MTSDKSGATRADRYPYFGFFDADISILLETAPWLAVGFDCVVTCLDSDTKTAEILTRCLPSGAVTALGKFGVIAGTTAIEFKDVLFSGFDEVYIFAANTWRNIDPSIWTDQYTSDRIALRDVPPSTLLATFSASGALRFASDGTGLNLMTNDEQEFTQIAALLSRV